MKAICIAILAVSASMHAQTQTSYGAHSPNIKNVQGNVNVADGQAKPTPPPPAPPPPTQTAPNPTPPAPTATPVEPKHSEATATLRAVEAEKTTLLTQQNDLINQVNAMVGSIRTQISAKEAEAAAQEKVIREENGWGDDVQYIPPTPQPNGTTAPGKWQKPIKK